METIVYNEQWIAFIKGKEPKQIAEKEAAIEDRESIEK